MKLVNIHNQKRKLYLFLRDQFGNQVVTEDQSFHPYYYEKDATGKSLAIDGTTLKKIFCAEPGDVAKKRSSTSYEADIPYTRRYMIDKVDKLEPCQVRWMMIDIEVLTREFPDYKYAKAPVSCISAYDSVDKQVKTWFMGDILDVKSIEVRERNILNSFINYVRETKPDIIFAWNVTFDYNYLQARIKKFAELLSPISQVRTGDHENKILYPAGISIVDYMGLFKKVYMREQSYRLDAVAQKHLGEQSWGEATFDTLKKEVKEKNANDVMRLVKLEEKFGLVKYYDEIRRLSKCQWEDLPFNSRVVEMLLFAEAKRKNIILPNKRDDIEKEEFQGATREAEKLGVSHNIFKHDLTSAYPSLLKDFCLDPGNILKSKSTTSVEIEGTHFEQNSDALLPSVMKHLLDLKDAIKKKLGTLDITSEDYRKTKILYEAIKAVVNSGYGAVGNRFFRIYDKRIASATTFLVRDLLLSVKKEVENLGNEVIFHDTDSLFIQSQDNINDKLNQFITDWAKKYAKDKLSTSFEFEGVFEKILILSKCRYFGILKTKKGIQEEIKGVEVKRSDSSKFMAEFQRNLIYKVLDGMQKDDVLKWVKLEIDRMKTLPLEDIAFPCKINRKLDSYKATPIFVRALRYTQSLVKLDKLQGELFYYIYVKPFGYDTPGAEAYYLGTKRIEKTEYDVLPELDKVRARTRTLKSKDPKNVLAFDKTIKAHIKDVDFDTMTDRNILSKCDVIFESLGWKDEISKLRVSKTKELDIENVKEQVRCIVEGNSAKQEVL